MVGGWWFPPTVKINIYKSNISKSVCGEQNDKSHPIYDNNQITPLPGKVKIKISEYDTHFFFEIKRTPGQQNGRYGSIAAGYNRENVRK